MYDELIYPGSWTHSGQIYYIAKVHPEDSFYKYKLVGCKLQLHKCISYSYPPQTSYWTEGEKMRFGSEADFYPPFWYLASGLLLDGPLAGEDVSFWKVMLSEEFPFFTVMREAAESVDDEHDYIRYCYDTSKMVEYGIK